ncbi:MAG: helix-turn-helix domain-containing protein [Thermanaeromonas sp.]|uniref:hypothetical protein n=1 Tax=Thermanaeromonas sp. TaxID=2003697 RepID=UPI00243B79FB|nr:hypothetical protein [Thermanaeromonas sp.]MCG0277821.1 helix-turn-helix domain-containing protein [Thermanaeromonas sp.]
MSVRFWTVTDLTKELNILRRVIYNAVTKGRLYGTRLGPRFYIPHEEVKRILGTATGHK